MDENLGNTPNPLNPTPSSPQKVTPRPIPNSTQKVTPRPIPNSTQNVTPSPIPNSTIDPMSRPMEQAPAAEHQPVKKKKTGLIIGAIICLFLAIGCGVTAALLLLTPKADPVIAAFDKILNRQTAPNLSIKGNIDLEVNDKTNQISKINLSISSGIIGNSTVNSTNAVLTATMRNGEQTSFKVDEMYTNNGDLYLKLDGISNFIESMSLQAAPLSPEDDDEFDIEEEVVTEEVELEELDVEVSGMPSMDFLENEWIRISSDELSEYISSVPVDDSMTCTINSLGDLNSQSNTISKMYQDNQFISSTDQNVQIASRKYPVYLINIDGEKLTNFANAISSTELAKNLSSCFSSTNNAIDSESIAELLNKLPNIYVEVNESNDFSRVYFTTPIADNAVTLTVDIDLSYPNTVNITEPTEYQDLSTLLQNNTTTFEELDNQGIITQP